MAKDRTSTEVGRLLGISTKTLYLWERSGKIPKPRRDRRGWRLFTPAQVDAIRRYAGPGDREDEPATRRGDGPTLAGLTARNQLRGIVAAISSDGLLSEVVLRLGDGQEVVAVVTRSSVRRLGLKKNQRAMAVIKATEVMLYR
jgi:molybdopterin-binding protein